MDTNPFVYIAPNEASVEKIKVFREACNTLNTLILETIPACRERSVAITNLEQVSMWGNKGIVFNQ
jgi:hypothetical protein